MSSPINSNYKKILIIATSYDKTCDYIIKKFPHIQFFRFNIDEFSSYKISVSEDGFEIINKNMVISNKDCQSIYLRNLDFENLDGIFEERYHNFSYSEYYAVIEGIVNSFDGVCLSKSYIIKKSGNKISQTFIAKNVGFIMPVFKITESV